MSNTEQFQYPPNTTDPRLQNQTQGQAGMQQGNHYDPTAVGSGQHAIPAQDRNLRDITGNTHEGQRDYAGADFGPGNMPGGQGGYAGPGPNSDTIPGNLPGGQGGYAGRGGGGGGGANVGTMSADPMASSRFPERELGQNATSYGGGPGPAAAPVGGRSNRTGASTGDKLVGQLEKATGKMTGNPEMVARGETRKMGEMGGRERTPPY